MKSYSTLSLLIFLEDIGVVSPWWGKKNDWAGEKGIFVTTFPFLLSQPPQVRQRVYPVLRYERSLYLRNLTTLILSSKYISGRCLTIKKGAFCLCSLGILSSPPFLDLPSLGCWMSSTQKTNSTWFLSFCTRISRNSWMPLLLLVFLFPSSR